MKPQILHEKNAIVMSCSVYAQAITKVELRKKPTHPPLHNNDNEKDEEHPAGPSTRVQHNKTHAQA